MSKMRKSSKLNSRLADSEGSSKRHSKSELLPNKCIQKAFILHNKYVKTHVLSLLFYFFFCVSSLSIYSSFKMFFLMNPETVSKTTKRIPPLFVYETVSVTRACEFCFVHLPRTQSQNLGQEASVQGSHTNHTMLAYTLDATCSLNRLTLPPWQQ